MLQRYRIYNCADIAEDGGGYCLSEDVAELEASNQEMEKALKSAADELASLMKMNDKKRLVEVCSECSMASCWHGVHMCWESTNAGTITKTVEQLDRLKHEHKDYYSKENIKKLFGDEAPHGYET